MSHEEIMERFKIKKIVESVAIFSVAQKLASLGWTIHSTSFNSAIDLIIEKNNQLRKIQVKGRLKIFPKRNKKGLWLFIAASRSINKRIQFDERYSSAIDYVIMVGVEKVNGEIVPRKFMIFPTENIPKAKGISMFESHIKGETYHPKKYTKFENAWELIK